MGYQRLYLYHEFTVWTVTKIRTVYYIIIYNRSLANLIQLSHGRGTDGNARTA